MKLMKYLISIILFVICIQIIEAKHVYRQGNSLEEICGIALVKSENLRGIRDVWAKIRESAINTWNYIKTMAQKTKQKINILIEQIKEHANDIKNNFEKKITELKDKLHNIIIDIHGTGELVKQCIKKEKENIDYILKEIIVHMSECIAEEINNLKLLNSAEQQPAMNETKFLRGLDEMVDLCERDLANVHECLCKVREDIFDNFTGMETDILENHFEARNIVDDIKGTLVACSLDNLIDATNLISIEIVEIAHCVLEAKGKEAESPE